jgi:hypothetical protein
MKKYILLLVVASVITLLPLGCKRPNTSPSIHITGPDLTSPTPNAFNAGTIPATTIPSSTYNGQETNALISIVFGARAAPYNLTVGYTQRFRAYGTYADGSKSDITNKVIWITSNTSVAIVSSTGLATGITTGTTNITASLHGINSPTVALRVVPPYYMTVMGKPALTLCGLAVIPANPATLSKGVTQQFTVTYTYSNGDSYNDNPASHPSWFGAYWNSSDPSVATINQLGTATAVGSGITYITAYEYGVNSPEVALIVTSP